MLNILMEIPEEFKNVCRADLQQNASLVNCELEITNRMCFSLKTT
jgi:hypothetical protein